MEEQKDGAHQEFATYEFQTDELSVQDAMIVLAVRMMGEEIKHNPSAKQNVIALARSSPLFTMEDYEETEGRISRFVNWAGSAAMDELFPQALRTLKGDYRRQALAWATANAISQQASDEKIAFLHRIGQDLGFTAAEIKAEMERCIASRTQTTEEHGL
jgi:hypothetical protein